MAVIAEEQQLAALDFNNTKAKVLQNTISDLQNAKILFFTTGLAQLLESYCFASLEAQYSSHLPIQVWARVDEVKAELESLAENWTWSTKNLKLSGIGTPKLIVDNVMETGSYTPYVPPGSVRKNRSKVSNDIDFEQLISETESKNFDDITLFDEENQRVLELAGSLQISNISPETLQSVSNSLKEVALELKQNLDLRLKKTNLQDKTIRAFGTIHDDSDPTSHQEITLSLLKDVIDSLPPRQRELFDAISCHEGFWDWNKFWKNYATKNGHELPIKNIHLAYQSWAKQPTEKFSQFQERLDKVHIRGSL